MPTLRPLPLLAALVLGACAAPPETEGPGTLPVLTLGTGPTLEIGVVEGDENYAFQDVTSVLRLASGNLVVADRGASDLSLYDASGAFVRRWGGRGEGPGEFRNLVRLYPLGPDSLQALDGFTGQLAVFDTAGAYAHQVPLTDVSADTLFALDVWLYGRFWVDGALGREHRAAVRRALDALPAPRSGPGYRFVRVASNGDLWIREPGVDAAGDRTWTVLDAAGAPRAVARTPADFDPQSIGPREVLGRWSGESDVHFVRAYALVETGEEVRPPAWLTEPAPAAPTEAPDEAAFTEAIKGALMGMARAQEIHYSTALTYTARLDSLEWERPQDVEVDVVQASPRGWVVVFTHPGLERICGLGYGFTVPPGWSPGAIVCGPTSGAGA